jgi:hypothetical protein
VHAEEFRPGGEVSHGDSPDVAVRYAEVFARLMADLADVTVASPLPNPLGALGPHGFRGVAGACRACWAIDFEAQHLRWHGREVWAVHDWDSLAWPSTCPWWTFSKTCPVCRHAESV